jgi:hypothetical protein
MKNISKIKLNWLQLAWGSRIVVCHKFVDWAWAVLCVTYIHIRVFLWRGPIKLANKRERVEDVSWWWNTLLKTQLLLLLLGFWS